LRLFFGDTTFCGMKELIDLLLHLLTTLVKIGSVRWELLDHTFFWTVTDLENTLYDYRCYYNEYRTHAGRAMDRVVSWAPIEPRSNSAHWPEHLQRNATILGHFLVERADIEALAQRLLGDPAQLLDLPSRSCSPAPALATPRSAQPRRTAPSLRRRHDPESQSSRRISAYISKAFERVTPGPVIGSSH